MKTDSGLQRAVTESKVHLVKRGNIYVSLGLLLSIVASTYYIGQKVQKVQSTIEWNTRQISELLMTRSEVASLKTELAVLRVRVKNLEDE